MKKRVTLTIGIPAYNEQGNIRALLMSILKQEKKTYKLEKIIVVSEGSTDKTAEHVKKLAKKYRSIRLIDGTQRKGKAAALNKIYKMHSSDYLLTFDADVLPENKYVIDLMVNEITKDKKVNLVGPRHVPVKANTLFGKFSYYSYISFEDAFLQINNGNNYYAVMCAELMTKKFTKSFAYPAGTLSDQNYVYAMATKGNRKGFLLVKDARIYFRTATTFQDWRILGIRSVIGDKEDVIKHFGRKILKHYSMPRNIYMISLLKWFFKNPIYMTGSILMNVFIRKFPYKKVTPKNGMWDLVTTTKLGIAV